MKKLLLLLALLLALPTQAAEVRFRLGAIVAPIVGFVAPTSNGSEATTTVNIPVTLQNATGATVTVDYAVTGGTATGSGTDYTLASGQLSFSGATVSQNITVTVVNDSSVESDETIQVTLSNATGGASLGTTVHTYTILDNDTSGSTITHIASNVKASANATTVDSDPLNTTGATYGLACTSSIGNLVLADNRGGTWTELDVQGSSTEVRLWVRSGGTFGTNTVVSVTNNGTRYPALAAAFYSGVASTGTPAKAAQDGTTISPGSITPGAANNLLVTCLGAGNNTGVATVPSTYTGRGVAQYVDGVSVMLTLADKIQTSATASNPQWVVANNSSLRSLHFAATP